MKFLCRIFGHKWAINMFQLDETCLRCGKTRTSKYGNMQINPGKEYTDKAFKVHFEQWDQDLIKELEALDKNGD